MLPLRTDQTARASESSTAAIQPISTGTPARPDALALPSIFDWLHLDDLAIDRAARESWNSFAAVPSSAAGGRKRAAERLLRAQRITRQQREFSLVEQKKTGEKLGDLLVRLGWLSIAELDAAFALQHRQDEADHPFLLGNILIALGVISQAQLDDAILRQRLSRKRLGELLVEAGHAQPGEVRRGLSLQRKLQKAALVTFLSFATMAAAPMASADGHAGSISVSASVMPSAQLRVVYQSTQLTIAAADIGRGYKDVPADSQIEVKSNSREGFALTFDTMPKLFKAVQITGLGGVVELGTEGGTVVQRKSGRQSVSLQLGYRFIFSDGVQPGNYAWPIMLSARAL